MTPEERVSKLQEILTEQGHSVTLELAKVIDGIVVLTQREVYEQLEDEVQILEVLRQLSQKDEIKDMPFGTIMEMTSEHLKEMKLDS